MISCTATGDQPIQIQWAKQGQPYLPRSVFARGGQLGGIHELCEQ